jgi:predicted alpha/beta hydrolase family esterase
VTRPQPPTVVIVPGLRGHVPGHWQTLLAERLDSARTVPPLGRDRLSRAARVAALDRVLAGVAGPVILVAHSAGVMTTVHWAQRPSRPVQAALLATPPDFGSPLPDGYPALDELYDNGWCPTPCDPLPFPSVAAASSNDPLAGIDRVAALAAAWGSRLVDVGAVGHLNPASGYGHWARGEELIRELAGSAMPGHARRSRRGRPHGDRRAAEEALATARQAGAGSASRGGGRVRETPAVSGSSG